MKVKEAEAVYKTLKKKYTYQDYLELPDDGKRYEIINGELVMVAAPFTIHIRISKKIYNLLLSYSEDETKGEIFYAPIDVVLGETNVFQPDLLYIKKENSYIITEKNIYGAPDLIVEILSPSTAYYDLLDKKEIYAQFGVQEYWIVDPKKQWIEIYLNAEGEFKLDQRLDKTGTARSQVLQGFEVELEDIFQTN